MSEGDAVVRTAVANGGRKNHRPLPSRVLEAFDALALHDADPLDGTGIQLALEWEWERAEHEIPEGITREDLVAPTGAPAPIGSPSDEGERGPNEEEAHRGTTKEEEEAA